MGLLSPWNLAGPAPGIYDDLVAFDYAPEEEGWAELYDAGIGTTLEGDFGTGVPLVIHDDLLGETIRASFRDADGQQDFLVPNGRTGFEVDGDTAALLLDMLWTDASGNHHPLVTQLV